MLTTWSKYRRDLAAVRVYRNDVKGLEKAIAALKRQCIIGGVFTTLGMRKKYPSIQARRRFKRRKSLKRYLKQRRK